DIPLQITQRSACFAKRCTCDFSVTPADWAVARDVYGEPIFPTGSRHVITYGTWLIAGKDDELANSDSACWTDMLDVGSAPSAAAPSAARLAAAAATAGAAVTAVGHGSSGTTGRGKGKRSHKGRNKKSEAGSDMNLQVRP